MKVILLILLSLPLSCHFKQTVSETQTENVENDTIYSNNENEWGKKTIEIDTLIIRGKDTAIVIVKKKWFANLSNGN